MLLRFTIFNHQCIAAEYINILFQKIGKKILSNINVFFWEIDFGYMRIQVFISFDERVSTKEFKRYKLKNPISK